MARLLHALSAENRFREFAVVEFETMCVTEHIAALRHAYHRRVTFRFNSPALDASARSQSKEFYAHRNHAFSS